MNLNHYEVLKLKTRSSVTPPEVKSAYHKALLQHHPDKAPRADTLKNNHSLQSQKDSTVSIDSLSLAYQTLSDPKLKAEYDRLLVVSDPSIKAGLLDKVHHAGVETVDLEDMDYDDSRGLWRRACRCGDARAYEVTEDELEREQSHGEIYVGCKGCSLFMKVLFEVMDEDVNEAAG